jgi:hypothetical protein
MKRLLLIILLMSSNQSFSQPILGIVGDITNWGSSPDIPMFSNDGVLWTANSVSISSSGGIIFRYDNSWGSYYGWNQTGFGFPSGNAVLNVIGTEIPVQPGVFNVSFVESTLEYTFTNVSTGSQISFHGGFNNYQQPVPMFTFDGIIYSRENFYFSNSDIKFREIGNQEFEYGGFTFPAGIASTNANSIPLTPGYYNVSFNKNTLAYDFEQVPVGLIGSAIPPFDFSVDVPMMSTDGGITHYLYNYSIVDGVARFRANGNWNYNLGNNNSEFPSGIATVEGGDISVASGTYDTIFLNRKTGQYCFGCSFPVATTECDSTLILQEYLTVVLCDFYSSPGNQYYTSSGNYIETLYSSNGCDSLIRHINLTVLNASSSAFSATICNGDTYTWNGQQYAQPGQYSQTLTNQFGCDSVVTLTLNVNTNDNISITLNPSFGNAPLNVAFANQTPNLSNYNFTWYFGDGTSQQSNAPFLSHIYTQNGYADVTVVADNPTTGCSSSQTFNDLIFVIGGVTCTHTATINQSGPLTGCVGDSILLSSNTDPSFTYQWNKNGIPVSGATSSSFYPTQSGSYTVTIYQNNCPVTSAGISVTMNALPSVPNITSSGTIVPCSGGSMTLTAPSGFTNYLWNTGSTASSLVVSQSGNYSVSVTNSNGCSQTSNPFAVNASFMAAPQVCIVGVDSLTNENRVVWEKPLTQGIDSFYVYKESNVSNVYTKIGATDYNDLAVFLDVNSNPAVQAYRYKISALDTCGVETNVGDFHKTIHLTINQGIGGAWNLIWSHYEGLNFGSYNIYRGTNPSNISLLTTIQSNLNSYSDLTPPTGPLYYQIEVVNPVNCDPTKIVNYGVARSNIVNNGVSGVIEVVNTNILVYPNPTNGNITLEASSELVGKRYSILDFSGRIILHGKISSNQEHIDLQHVARGSYYLSIEKSSSVTKLIKQ